MSPAGHRLTSPTSRLTVRSVRPVRDARVPRSRRAHGARAPRVRHSGSPRTLPPPGARPTLRVVAPGAQPERSQPRYDLLRGHTNAGRRGCCCGMGASALSDRGGDGPRFLGGGVTAPRFCSPVRRFAVAAHEAGSEGALRRVLVVDPAPRANALHRRLPAPGHRLDGVMLEPGARRTAVPVIAHERAPAAIAFPHRPPHLRRDGARVRARLRTAPTRPAGRRELALLEPGDQGVQRAVERFGQLAGGHGMAERVLGVREPLAGALPDGELKGVTSGRERRDPRMRRLG